MNRCDVDRLRQMGNRFKDWRLILWRRLNDAVIVDLGDQGLEQWFESSQLMQEFSVCGTLAIHGRSFRGKDTFCTSLDAILTGLLLVAFDLSTSTRHAYSVLDMIRWFLRGFGGVSFVVIDCIRWGCWDGILLLRRHCASRL